MNTAVTPDDALAIAHAKRQAARRRLFWAGAAGLAGLAVLAYGGHWWSTGRYLETTDDAYVRADWVALSPRVAGYVAEVMVEDDQPVHAGDVLVKLRSDDYRARLDQAQAAVTQAQAALNVAKARQQIGQGQTADRRRGHPSAARGDPQGRGHATQCRRRTSPQCVGPHALSWPGARHAATAQRLESARASADQAEANWQGAQAAWREARSTLAMVQARATEAGAVLEQQQDRTRRTR